MSKWTDVRDNVVDALHVEDITEDVKQHVTNTILSELERDHPGHRKCC